MIRIFPCSVRHPWESVRLQDSQLFFHEFRQRCKRISGKLFMNWVMHDPGILSVLLYQHPSLIFQLQNEPIRYQTKKTSLQIWMKRLLSITPSPGKLLDHLFDTVPYIMQNLSQTLYNMHLQRKTLFDDKLSYLIHRLPIQFDSHIVRQYSVVRHPESDHLYFTHEDANGHLQLLTIDLERESYFKHKLYIPREGGHASHILSPIVCTDITKLCLMYVYY